ncbi:hypothetical protein RR46_02347 [Papilio xuthus]|uniref:Endonuclease-reverse transcriptase n=1 Tax=Papilio xuthus TaxID=66420 RepID=A0A194Q6W3_PAPXU|nr:hypothetical protein RR46_02347 [Papilio xuthus]
MVFLRDFKKKLLNLSVFYVFQIGISIFSLKVAPVIEKLRSKRLAWFGHVMRRDDDISKKVMRLNVDGYKGRGRPKKVWNDCVKEDMRRKGVDFDMTAGRDVWRSSTYCADPQ